jgi:hypothetical protein
MRTLGGDDSYLPGRGRLLRGAHQKRQMPQGATFKNTHIQMLSSRSGQRTAAIACRQGLRSEAAI